MGGDYISHLHSSAQGTQILKDLEEGKADFFEGNYDVIVCIKMVIKDQSLLGTFIAIRNFPSSRGVRPFTPCYSVYGHIPRKFTLFEKACSF